MTILGIETSCDETSLGIYHNGVLQQKVFSQEIHNVYGGVIPELASREHVKALKDLYSFLPENIDLIGVTLLPGLPGPLMTGLNFAKNLSFFQKIPLIGIHHLHAHLEIIHYTQQVSYPYFGVVVSGGNTCFYEVSSPFSFQLLEKTEDDAIGEAFDKGGKLLGLGYPAGHKIDALARKGSFIKNLFTLPKHNLSFSGFKSALSRIKDLHSIEDLAMTYEKCLIDHLAQRIHHYKPKNIVFGGGVSLNSYLRESFPHAHFTEKEYCSDNGAMIAWLAFLQQEKKVHFPNSLSINKDNSFL
jgi:N6-L-threonylcarbamoyladenine synthase